ncbi:MAG TPA: branched-chain amino acid ABC transporter permease [Euzebyales bacterium]|nr:branched-chain amino acid ABC transporter permease [Euzebyales bacterium]
MARQTVDPGTAPATPSDTPAHAPAATRDRGRRLVLAGLLLVLLALPLLRPVLPAYNYVLQLGLVTFMWVAMASSWNILGGFAGYISLGHNVFYAVGGYVSGLALLYFGLSPLVTALFGGLVAVVVGLVIGLITLRTRGPAFIISTIALLLMVRLWFDNWDRIGGSNGASLPLPPFPVAWAKAPFYYAMLVTAIGAVYLAYRVRHSKFGLGLRAIAQDEIKAEVAGIDTRMYKVMAFAVSVFWVAVAGAIWGYSLSYLRPTIFLTIAVAAEMVLMVIVGGKGTVAGPVVGAVLLVFVHEFSVARFGSSELNLVVTGGLLLIVLLFFPAGVVGTLRERRRLPRILDWD